MTLNETKKQTLALIEEIDTSEKSLTRDPDIGTKLNNVINQIQYELSRIKKIPAYIEIEVNEGDLVDFKRITTESGKKNEVYQIDIARGVDYETKAQGTILKCLETGTLELDYFIYPIRITEETSNEHVMELSPDVLEVLPYGVAADVLKSDPSNSYGQIYADRYERMKRELDMRYNTGSIEIEGGIDV